MSIQVSPGLEASLDATQHNAFEALIQLPIDRFNQVKDFLSLDMLGTLGPTTLSTFISKATSANIDFSDAGVNAFKAKKGLANSGSLHGVIGPQTAEAMVSQMMGQDIESDSGVERQINQAGLDLVKEFEGFQATIPGRPGFVKAYLDPVNVATIGYGHTEGVTMGMVITAAQAESFLREDLSGSAEDVQRLVKVDLTDNQFAALVSFVFNLGAGSLASSTLLRLLNQKNYSGAAGEFLKWVNAGGRPLAGLVRRRKAERALFLAP